MNEILGFFKEYRYLSNFHHREFTYKGKTYLSSEHAYQACKATNEADHEYVRAAPTAKDSRHRGRWEIKPRSDFDKIKYDLMYDILIEKFKDPELREKLNSTGNAFLEETNWWHDNYWGNCTCDDCQHHKGLNNLGKILMQIRVNSENELGKKLTQDPLSLTKEEAAELMEARLERMKNIPAEIIQEARLLQAKLKKDE